MWTVSANKLHRRPPISFHMRIWLEALWMWGVGGLQVHGIRSCRLVYKEVVEVRSNYNKSYFWWCWLLRLIPGERGEHLTSQLSWAAARLLVTCGRPVYLVVDELRPRVLWPLMIELMLVLLTFFDIVIMVLLIGSWCYSREWVRNLRTKLCSIASGKWNVSKVSLQRFDINYIMV